jgi:hypothetical protein
MDPITNERFTELLKENKTVRLWDRRSRGYRQFNGIYHGATSWDLDAREWVAVCYNVSRVEPWEGEMRRMLIVSECELKNLYEEEPPMTHEG